MEGHGFGLDGSRGWASALWSMLAEDAVWGVPRSGLTFQKRGSTFVLIDQMPWMVGMSVTPEELAEIQRDEIDGIKAVFSSIGVTVLELEV